METKLKPCPFCEEAEFIVVQSKRRFNMYFHYVFCQVCGARGPINIDKQGAIEAWNRRAEEKDDNKN